jgi:bifunctional DNA-binding transcriptional regulator/antitoxin component of YhaV-PrlF toxin-antitoxin module
MHKQQQIEHLKDSESREWIKRYKKKVLEEGRGEAQYWWNKTIKEIAAKRGQKTADDLKRRMNEQREANAIRRKG